MRQQSERLTIYGHISPTVISSAVINALSLNWKGSGCLFFPIDLPNSGYGHSEEHKWQCFSLMVTRKVGREGDERRMRGGGERGGMRGGGERGT